MGLSPVTCRVCANSGYLCLNSMFRQSVGVWGVDKLVIDVGNKKEVGVGSVVSEKQHSSMEKAGAEQKITPTGRH